MNHRVMRSLLIVTFVLVFFGLSVGTVFSSELEVHFLDVGQGDSIFILLPSKENILIDGGTSVYGHGISSYLKDLGVNRINHMIGTHPHEDHIGGLIQVLNDFPVDKIYMPRISHNSATYEKLLNTIISKNLRITTVVAGLSLALGDKTEAKFLAPNSDNYKSINDFSAVLRVVYGNTSFLFTGDAESVSEEDILKSFSNIKSDVLKVGHHGSNTSTSQAFLDAVSPEISVISVGLGNDYGHPHREVIKRLKDANVSIYHTDFDGTILIKSDGKNITVLTHQGSLESFVNERGNYVGNKNSKVFHRISCRTLPAEQNRVYFQSPSEAIAAGYRPCANCKP